MRCALSCVRAATLLPDMSGALIALQLLLVLFIFCVQLLLSGTFLLSSTSPEGGSVKNLDICAHILNEWSPSE